MFDNLREQANSVPYYDDEAQFEEAELAKPAPKAKAPRPQSAAPGRFLGMTPVQRFVLAFMLLISVCVLGSLCLLVLGRVSLF